ncbi:hypothetical protein, partial [Xylella fastidiosa]|uniref:hypothetical protein n=1 Tax=Xylella fastidiosa TaxID=2371 RepID=UPI001F2D648A
VLSFLLLRCLLRISGLGERFKDIGYSFDVSGCLCTGTLLSAGGMMAGWIFLGALCVAGLIIFWDSD